MRKREHIPGSGLAIPFTCPWMKGEARKGSLEEMTRSSKHRQVKILIGKVIPAPSSFGASDHCSDDTILSAEYRDSYVGDSCCAVI